MTQPSTMVAELQPTALVATRTRYAVVALTMLLAAITYLDRACIGTLAPAIMRDLALSKEQMSVVFSAFALAYAAFELPTASWADRKGARRTLTRIVTWWSAFTMLTSITIGFGSLVAMRFLFGLGEAGAWPCVAKVYSRWLPPPERGRAQGCFFAAALLAGGVTPLLVSALGRLLGWRVAFALSGAVGLIWVAGWNRWFRDDPAEHPSVNPAELSLLNRTNRRENEHVEGWDHWRRLLTHPNIWKLCLMYFPNSFVLYFCITWLPKYLEDQLGFRGTALACFSGLPLVLGTIGVLSGGVATDLVTKRFGLKLGRCGIGAAGYLAAGGALFLATRVQFPELVACLFAFALAASMFTLSAAWSTCLDIGGSHVGIVSASMNTSGQIASILSPLIAVEVENLFGNWNVFLFLMGAMFVFGALCWGLIEPGRKVFL